MNAPPNAPILTHNNRPCYISGITNIHLLHDSLIILRFTDTDSEFITIPYDNNLIRMYAPREIPFSSLTRHDKIKKR